MQNSSKSRGSIILYIEDTEANVSLMRLVLKRMEGVTLLHAPTAEIGIPMAIKEQPDLILMDIELPGMNGMAALQVLRQNQQTCEIPVIAVSGADVPQAMGMATFNASIGKPFNIQELPATLAKYMKGAR